MNRLAAMMAALVVGLAALPAQAADPRAALVDAVAQRLSVADQVALAKWDSGKAVEDKPREQQVIDGAVARGATLGLERDRVARFFADQIEANKLVQYVLLADWRRAGVAPATPRADLAGAIRPRLDRLQQHLLQLLAETAALRHQPDCRERFAQLAGAYVRQHDSDALYAIALDRALINVCE
ncbi:chorismate mutase [Crenobacter sp. SG2305]|uniref:chorismate mutase n=1 Tax=Crenobacter oryzisoli TaxID=3056844 RepID=UPI0025AA665B|nr:chorismate mutase [Crenobacter sp. SG2305]MDN0081970.1 chorismate mutase [Crenobacter sp. SG2305]